MPAMTPMMRQYLDIKEQNKDSILFFRLGDFYEMFGEDAKTASRELDLTLTSRDRRTENPDERMPMCGVPHHSSEAYIARLISKGYKVAICEQVEDASQAAGLVSRDIVRIVTPGTVVETSMLDESRPNYLCAVYIDEKAAICFADLSTGETSVTEFLTADTRHMENELSTFSPAEAILGGDESICAKLESFLKSRLDCLTLYCAERFSAAADGDALRRQFGENANLPLSQPAICAAGALITYLKDTQKTDISHLRTLRRNTGGAYMQLDMNTMRNLELAASLKTGDKKGSLLWVLDKTKTPMGRRLLRSWVLRPLLNAAPITRRLSAVGELVEETVTRAELIVRLKNIGDIERLSGKVVYGSANGRDLKALASSIAPLEEIIAYLAPLKASALCECRNMDNLSDIAEIIDNTLHDDPPFSVRDGGIIRTGADAEVDRLRGLLENSSDALTKIEASERERTGKKLKIGYNKVFGYYIEIPRSVSENVPKDYIRKQTLANCERFITEELKLLETELLTAKDKLAALEFKLFTELRTLIAGMVGRIQDTARLISELDAFCSLAETAAANNYCKPDIDVSGVLDIRDGRHPVVEITQSGTLFVPNDTVLDADSTRAAIITGPNMAGKSTYMRQTALITLMAQIGSFVPARSARIGLCDRIFTRIGASDDLSAGKSTFMVEMTEVADILHSATSKSLIILDEIGRGTSTYDGMSVARAVLEHCSEALGARTLFATHYHELTELENELSCVVNLNISAKKRGDDIIFLRKIVPGGADDSYGIEVAGLAGVPDSVIKRAKAALAELENGRSSPPVKSALPQPVDNQISLLDVSANEITGRLKSTDLNTLSPLEGLSLLFELKKLL